MPMPWADTAETSFVETPARYRAMLAAAGFAVPRERDWTAFVLAVSAKMRARIAKEGMPVVGLHLLLGPTARERLGRVVAASKPASSRRPRSSPWPSDVSDAHQVVLGREPRRSAPARRPATRGGNGSSRVEEAKPPRVPPPRRCRPPRPPHPSPALAVEGRIRPPRRAVITARRPSSLTATLPA